MIKGVKQWTTVYIVKWLDKDYEVKCENTWKRGEQTLLGCQYSYSNSYGHEP